MFLRRFTDFIFRSRLQTTAVTFFLAFIPLFGLMSIVIAALVTLRKGAFEGAIATIAASLPFVIGYFISPATAQTELAINAIWVVLISNFLTWLFALFLRHYGNWNLTFELAALIGALSLFFLHIYVPNVQSWWSTELNIYLSKTSDLVDAVMPNAMTPDLQKQVVDTLKKYASGLVVAALLVNALLQLVLARWWQSIIYNPGGLQKELHQIRLSYFAGIIFISFLALSYLGIPVVLDIMPLLLTLFFVAGLSLIHGFVKNSRPLGWLWLLIIYIGIIFLFPWSLLILSFIALIDIGMNLRNRFSSNI